MNRAIKDFVDIHSIDVVCADMTDNKAVGKKLVSIIQRGGSMSFHHAMNIQQARELAIALIACCNELEAS